MVQQRLQRDLLVPLASGQHGRTRLSELDDAHADPDRLKTAAPRRGPTHTVRLMQPNSQLESLDRCQN